MTRQMRQILVAIGDVQHAPKKELRKAAALARASGATLELFHAIDAPDPARGYPETVTQAAAARQRELIQTRSQTRLERFARDASLRGIRTTCTAVWDHPVFDAISRRVVATRADLVIAASRGHRFGARLVLRNTDWELIRHCPVPLLLVKSARPYQKPVVMAAVDPFHACASPADLDTRLLGAASQLAQLLKGSTHVFHAYMPLLSVEPAPISGPPLVVVGSETEAVHSQQVVRAINELAESAGVPRTRRHINMGDVAVELAAVSRRTHTGIVVMGAVSRSALARFFIGNTAEHVLDRLTCDVLIVKPREFVSQASAATAVRDLAPALAEAAGKAPRTGSGSTVTTGRVVLPPLF